MIVEPGTFDLKIANTITYSDSITNNPELVIARQQIEIAEAEKGVQSAKILPDLSIGYFNQSMIGSLTSDGHIASQTDRFTGVLAGVSIPLFFNSYRAEIGASKLKAEIAQVNADYYETVIQGQYERQFQEVIKYSNSLKYYEEKALMQADLIISNVQKSFENGAISYTEYFLHLNHALELKLNYLHTLNGYNQAITILEFLTGQ